jgi:hypothetical protein
MFLTNPQTTATALSHRCVQDLKTVESDKRNIFFFFLEMSKIEV